jgi:hypothetical protein
LPDRAIRVRGFCPSAQCPALSYHGIIGNTLEQCARIGGNMLLRRTLLDISESTKKN